MSGEPIDPKAQEALNKLAEDPRYTELFEGGDPRPLTNDDAMRIRQDILRLERLVGHEMELTRERIVVARDEQYRGTGVSRWLVLCTLATVLIHAFC